MPRLFKVTWPDFAWIEAALFFPVALMMALEITTSRLAADMGYASFGDAGLGMIEPVLRWVVPAAVAAALFLGLLVTVDRLLIVRGGFAILSCLATFIWGGAALVLSAWLSTLWPSSLGAGPGWVSFRGMATLVTIAASLFAHQKIFWIGLHDTGFAAGQLGVELKTNKVWRARLSRYQSEAPFPSREVGASGDVWSMRDLMEDVKILFRKLTESLVFQVVVGCSMGVVLLACWIIYSYRDSNGAPMPAQAELSRDAPPSQTETVDMRVLSTRENEGSGERDADGRYLFDVSVNDIPMPMRYDDDILLVTIRAEDALRLGISFARLDFSTKIKTAKGLVDVAGITITTMTVGKITYRLVPGYVTRPGALDENILGHSFLGRLAAYRVEQNRLVLIDRQGQSEIVSAVRPATQ